MKPLFRIARLVSMLALVIIARPPATVAQAITPITVNVFTDELNTDSDCSLREAIRAANTNAAKYPTGVSP